MQLKHLTKEQRYAISQMKSQVYKQQEIADVIGKNKSVVSSELKRNCHMQSGEYKSESVKQKYEQRQGGKPKNTIHSINSATCWYMAWIRLQPWTNCRQGKNWRQRMC